MNRRNFLRGGPLLVAAAAAPAVATAAAVVSTHGEVPMRGAYDDPGPGILTARGYWKAMEIRVETADVCEVFSSHSMRQRPDGKYELVFDREEK